MPVEPNGSVEHEPRLDPTLQHVGQVLLDVRPHRGRPAAHGHVAEEGRLRGGDRLVLRHADAADRTARAGDADGRLQRLFVAGSLRHRVDAVAASEVSDVLDGLLAPLAHHVCRAEFFCQLDAVVVAAHDDDLLRAKALGSDDAAQANGAVPTTATLLP